MYDNRRMMKLFFGFYLRILLVVGAAWCLAALLRPAYEWLLEHPVLGVFILIGLFAGLFTYFRMQHVWRITDEELEHIMENERCIAEVISKVRLRTEENKE